MNGSRHKNNLFFKRLATQLPFDSFRFDFRSVFALLNCVLPHTAVLVIVLEYIEGIMKPPEYGGTVV